MSGYYLGEIRIFGLGFAPRGWALCNGQIISIAQNTALFALLGTTYGGNGQSTFGLPDLRGRVPVHRDTAGLYPQGSSGGAEQMNLLLNSLPAHSHALNADGNPATTDSPSGAALASPARNGPEILQPGFPGHADGGGERGD